MKVCIRPLRKSAVIIHGIDAERIMLLEEGH